MAIGNCVRSLRYPNDNKETSNQPFETILVLPVVLVFVLHSTFIPAFSARHSRYTMNFTRATLAFVLLATPALSFTVSSVSFHRTPISKQHRFGGHNHELSLGQLKSLSAVKNFREFDSILFEGEARPDSINYNNDVSQREQDNQQWQHQGFVSNRRIALTGSRDTRLTVLASTTFPGAPVLAEELSVGDDALSKVASEEDPYANALDSRLGKIEQYQEQRQTSTLESRLKSMDLQDIILTLILPGILVFAGSRWAFNKVGGRMSQTSEEILDNFATEMLYHDGDFKEMELCVKDYKTKLVWMGPTKSDAMLKRYLESYAKKKTVSPQAIASLSYVFMIFKLSEEKAASILVALCNRMGTDKISSAGKLLFLGSRILKSPQGITALQPIKSLIMSTYRDERVAETLVDTSQQ